MPRELIYPCFLSCTEFTDDEYWKNIFEDLSFGITPSGTYISKKYIISNVKNKEFVYKINIDIDSETMFWDIYNLFSDKLGLKSVQEIEEYKNTIDSSEIIFNSWNSIKKKSIRDSIIINYVTDKSEKYKLSRIKTKELLNMINLGILLKFISNKNIIYENGIVYEIEGFEFVEGNFKFIKPNEYVPNQIEYNKYNVTLSELWTKFLEILIKSIFVSNKNLVV